MKKLSTPKKHVLVIISLILLFWASWPADLDANICEYALARCFGDASLLDWLSTAVLGQILYCLNGYDFCKKFVEKFI